VCCEVKLDCFKLNEVSNRFITPNIVTLFQTQTQSLVNKALSLHVCTSIELNINKHRLYVALKLYDALITETSVQDLQLLSCLSEGSLCNDVTSCSGIRLEFLTERCFATDMKFRVLQVYSNDSGHVQTKVLVLMWLCLCAELLTFRIFRKDLNTIWFPNQKRLSMKTDQ
jgi:hypothetical protein